MICSTTLKTLKASSQPRWPGFRKKLAVQLHPPSRHSALPCLPTVEHDGGYSQATELHRRHARECVNQQ